MEWSDIDWKRAPQDLKKKATFFVVITTTVLFLFLLSNLPGYILAWVMIGNLVFLTVSFFRFYEWILEEEWRAEITRREKACLPLGLRFFTIPPCPLQRRLGSYLWVKGKSKPEENKKWATEKGWKFLVARTKDIDLNFFFNDLTKSIEKKTGLKKKGVKEQVDFCSYHDNGDIIVVYYKVRKLSI